MEGYKVRVRFNEQGEIEEASCSCPYEGGGDCKHIVAALLVLIRQPEKVSVRPSLRTLLEGQSREQLIALLLFLADHYPETIEAIEDFLTAPAPTEEQPTEVNLSALQAQIRAKLRQIARDAYQAYLDYGEWPLPSEALEPAINQARTFLDRGEPSALVTPPRVGPKTLADPQPTGVGKGGVQGGGAPVAGGVGVSPHKTLKGSG